MSDKHAPHKYRISYPHKYTKQCSAININFVRNREHHQEHSNFGKIFLNLPELCKEGLVYLNHYLNQLFLLDENQMISSFFFI